MTRMVIVPNELRDAINAAIDEQIAKVPDAAPDREHFYQTLLNYYDQHGVIPPFELVPNLPEFRLVRPNSSAEDAA